MLLLLLLAVAVYVFEKLHTPQSKTPAQTPKTEEQPPTGQEAKPVTKPEPTPKPGEAEKEVPKPSVVSIESLRQVDLDNMITICQRARLVGLDPKSAEPRHQAFPLDKLYVALDTKTPVEVKGNRKD